MTLPPWIADQPHKDNWLAVARVRNQAEIANPGLSEPTNIAEVIDRQHEF
jgi:hypothetical protein